MRIPKFVLLIAYYGLFVVAKVVNVDKKVLNRSYALLNERSILTAGGMLFWFLAFQLRLQVPKYNVYHLFQNDTEQQHILLLLKPRVSNYRIAKQYYLLAGDDIKDSEFSLFVKETLQTAMRDNVVRTSFKKHQFSREKALSALADINKYFRENNAKLFLVSGTLLGFIRDGGPIVGDNDIDLGVFDDDTNSLLAIEQLSKESWVGHLNQTRNFVQINHTNGVVIDIFIHYKENGQMWHGTDIHRWHNTPFELMEKQFESLVVFIPRTYEKYLDENYGDWSKRALFWDYSFDTPNREFGRNRKTIFFLLERAVRGVTAIPPDRYLTQTAIQALTEHFQVDLDYSSGVNTYNKRWVESKR